MITDTQQKFIDEVTKNLKHINNNNLSDYDFKLGYAVLSFLVDKYMLDQQALELIQFYKDNSKRVIICK